MTGIMLKHDIYQLIDFICYGKADELFIPFYIPAVK